MNYFKQLAVITTLTLSFNCLANENPDNIWVTIDSTAAEHYQHEQGTFLQKMQFRLSSKGNASKQNLHDV